MNKTNIIIPVIHIYPIFCAEREKLQQHLSENGVETLIHYPIPPHKQEALKEFNKHEYPITEHIHREELSLPCNPTMSDCEVEKSDRNNTLFQSIMVEILCSPVTLCITD